MDLTHKHNNDFLVGRDIFLNFACIYTETIVYQMICCSIVLKFLFERYLSSAILFCHIKISIKP